MRHRWSLSDIPFVRDFIKKHTRLVFAICAVVALIYGINRYMDYQEKVKIVEACTAETQGEVVSTQTKNGLSSRRRTKYRGVVEFEVDDKKYTAYTAWQTTALVARKKVTVYYDPSDPSRNCTENTNSSAENIGALVAFGLFVLLVIIIIIDYYNKQKKRKDPLANAAVNTIEQPDYDDIFK